MCRNHSHIAAEITGTVIIGRNTLVEVRLDTQLVVELPFGAKWIRPSGLHLLMPYSTRAGLPLLTPAQMAVYYIPSSCSTENASITTPEMERRLRRSGVIGETVLRMTGLFPPWKDEEDNESPF